MKDPLMVQAVRRLRKHEPEKSVLVRLTPSSRRILREAAAQANLSLNDYCITKLLAGSDEELFAAIQQLERADWVI